MKLIYCYIHNFRNIEKQDINLSNLYNCSFHDGKLLIEQRPCNELVDYIYTNNFMKDLRIIVGKTGSGKTNFLQLIGMDDYERKKRENRGSYFLLYKMAGENQFMVEMSNVIIQDLVHTTTKKQYGDNNISALRFQYDFNTGNISNVHPLLRNEKEGTFIINAFDKSSFALCPYEDERREGVSEHDGLLSRMVSMYGRSNVSLESEWLKEYVNTFSANSIKRKAALVIRWDNWQDTLNNDLDEKLQRKDYWTYKDKTREFQEQAFKQGKYDLHIKFGKGSTPKSRFLHDLMTDFAIHLRKWADCVKESRADNSLQLPDGMNISVLERIDMLGQYIDYHTDEMNGCKGLVWQECNDIIDLFHLLSRMDNKYFTDEEFLIPVTEIDSSEGSIMCDVFERMDQYRPDQVGVFTKQLLPYHWSYISSGEYQYAKIWGVVDKFGVRTKVCTQGEHYENARFPNLILLLDEPETYMHPEMCRIFISKFDKILSQRGMDAECQVIFTTHSPFMLSDVLSNQIIRMSYDNAGKGIIESGGKPYFAANIHSVMADGFFLDYTIGEKSRLFLTEKYNLLKYLFSKEEKLTEHERKEVMMLEALMSEVGDDIIRHSFLSLIKKIKV